MLKKSLAAAGLAVAFMFIPTAANALDCSNASRPSNFTGAQTLEGGIIAKGNWVWYPSVFGPGSPEVWVFVPPGSLKVFEPDAPLGQKGNFQSGEGFALLVNAICDSNGAVLESRQTENGIQLLHGCG